MLEDIVFAIMVIIAVGAGVWVWWREVHGVIPEPKTKEQNKDED